MATGSMEWLMNSKPVVGVVERAERFLGAFVLGAGVDQRALRAGERQLVVVTFDQVLADFRADGFDQVTDIAQDRVVASHRMVALAQVIQTDQAEQRGDQRYRPQPGMLGQQGQAGESEDKAEYEAGVAAGKRVFHGSIAGRMTGPRIGKRRGRKTWVIGKRLLPDCEFPGLRSPMVWGCSHRRSR